MVRFTSFRRHSFSYGGRLHQDSEESESLLGGGVEAESAHELENLNIRLKKRGESISSFQGLKPRDQTMEYVIQPDDTLVSISFKYNVHIAELKRVNMILNDMEFFALKNLKIPVHPASLLTEMLPGDPPLEQGIFQNNNGWKVENKEETPNKSLVSNISLTSPEPTSPGSEADSEGPTSPHMAGSKCNKQKKKVRKMLKDVDKDLNNIRIKQAELDDWIKSSEAVEQANNISSKRVPKKELPESTYSSFKLACLCSFFLVSSVIVLGGLITIVSIEHSVDEDGDW